MHTPQPPHYICRNETGKSMKATREYVERKFDEFNRLIFAGRLPRLPIYLSDASTFLGVCVSKSRRLPDGRMEHYDFRLRINTRISLSEREIEDTIIHEMIHYFILYNGLADTSPHGEIFKAMMRAINRQYGRNIRISHKINEEQREEAAGADRRWHVIAVISMRSGATGIKVLPRVIPKILDFYRKIDALPEVREVRLYLHDEPFFNRYPTSTAMRMHEVDPALLAEKLQGAKTLTPSGTRLLQR